MSLQALKQEDADVFVSRSISPLTSNHPLQGPPLLAFLLTLLQPYPCAPPTTSFPPPLLLFLHFFYFLLFPSFCFLFSLLLFILLPSSYFPSSSFPLSIILFPFLSSSVSLLSFSSFSFFHPSVFLLISFTYYPIFLFLIFSYFSLSSSSPYFFRFLLFPYFSSSLLVHCLLSLYPFFCTRASYHRPSFFVFSNRHRLSSLYLHHSAVFLVIFCSVLSFSSYMFVYMPCQVFLSESVNQLLSQRRQTTWPVEHWTWNRIKQTHDLEIRTWYDRDLLSDCHVGRESTPAIILLIKDIMELLVRSFVR